MSSWEMMAVVSLLLSGACFAMVAHKACHDREFDKSGLFWAVGNLVIALVMLCR